MGARSGGSFAALLMTGPLAAIPLMAVFGIPQFAVFSPTTEQVPDDLLRQPPPVTVAEQSTWPGSHNLLVDANGKQPMHADSRIPTSLVTQAATDSTSVPMPLAESQPAEPIDSFPGATAATGPPPAWQHAAARLQELGIDDYRLERGDRGGSFLFVCQFAPGGDARIVRRFEAEAAEPAEAVRQVLTQIDNWQQRTDSSRAR